MAIKLLCIGKTSHAFLQEGEDEYLKRLRRFAVVSKVEIPEVKKSNNTPEMLTAAESKELLRKIRSNDIVIGLDEEGKEYSSSGFARQLQNWLNRASGDLLFVVGGAWGFSPELRNRFDAQLSLSALTFSHQMVRMIFLEQLYRGFSILGNHPYHNEGRVL